MRKEAAAKSSWIDMKKQIHLHYLHVHRGLRAFTHFPGIAVPVLNLPLDEKDKNRHITASADKNSGWKLDYFSLVVFLPVAS